MDESTLDLEGLIGEAEQSIAAAKELPALDQVRVAYLGKSGQLTAQLKQLGKLPAAERPKAGQAINKAKQALQQAIEARKTELESEQLKQRLASETIDVTLPGRGLSRGGLCDESAPPARSPPEEPLRLILLPRRFACRTACPATRWCKRALR